MQHVHNPFVPPGSLPAQVDSYIKNIFTTYSSDDVALIDVTWYFKYVDEIKEFINQNQNKHLLILSATDPYYFQPRLGLPTLLKDIENDINRKRCEVSEHFVAHKAGYTLIGNVWNENYFCFWLEFMRQYHIGRFEFDYNTVDITKVFMCLNRKPHPHRQRFVKRLYDANLHHDGYISLGHDPSMENFSLPTPILLDNDIVNEECEDMFSKRDDISCDVTSLGHPDNWQSFFVNVVVETKPGAMDFISEKTLKPILGYKPFIILGSTATYDILHSWGIDTFDDIFGCDHTDNECDHEYAMRREEHIMRVLEDLKTQDLNLLYKSLLPRLIKNKEALLNAMEKNHKYIVALAKQF